MGFITIDYVLENIQLKPGPKIVLIALAKHVKDNKQFQNLECWPSNRLLAELTGMSERHVKRVIKELIQQNYVSIKIAGGGSKKSNRYQLNLTHLETSKVEAERVTSCPPSTAKEAADTEIKKGDNLSSNSDMMSKRVTPCPKKGDTMSPESIKESIRESINEADARRRESDVINLETCQPSQTQKKPPPAMWQNLKQASW